MSGGIHSGGFDSRDICERLNTCFPNGKVLIVIREQKSMLYSAYSQYIKGGGSYSIKEYLFPKTKKVKGLFKFNYLEYHHLIEYYYKYFGKNNVLVLPYEMMKEDQERFLQNILFF